MRTKDYAGGVILSVPRLELLNLMGFLVIQVFGAYDL